MSSRSPSVNSFHKPARPGRQNRPEPTAPASHHVHARLSIAPPTHDTPASSEPSCDIGAQAITRAAAALKGEHRIWLNVATLIGRAIAEFEEYYRDPASESDDEFCEGFHDRLRWLFENAKDGCEPFIFEFIRTDGLRFDWEKHNAVAAARKKRLGEEEADRNKIPA